jgi:hypothetical protein
MRVRGRCEGMVEMMRRAVDKCYSSFVNTLMSSLFSFRSASFFFSPFLFFLSFPSFFLFLSISNSCLSSSRVVFSSVTLTFQLLSPSLCTYVSPLVHHSLVTLSLILYFISPSTSEFAAAESAVTSSRTWRLHLSSVRHVAC